MSLTDPGDAPGSGPSFDPPPPRIGFPGVKAAFALFFLLIAFLVALDVAVDLLARRVAPIESLRFDLAILLPQVALALVLAWYLPRAGLRLREVLVVRPFAPRLVAPLLVSMAGTFLFVTGVLGVFEIVFGPPDDLNAAFEELFEHSTPWVRWVGAAGLAPIMEELFFRGLLLRGLRRHHGPVVALVISSALFGVMHVHPYRILLATVLGLHLGWWFLRTGNLAPSIVAHGVVNFTIGVLLPELVDPELLDSWEQRAALGQVLPTLVAGAAVALLGFRWAGQVQDLDTEDD